MASSVEVEPEPSEPIMDAAAQQFERDLELLEDEQDETEAQRIAREDREDRDEMDKWMAGEDAARATATAATKQLAMLATTVDECDEVAASRAKELLCAERDRLAAAAQAFADQEREAILHHYKIEQVLRRKAGAQQEAMRQAAALEAARVVNEESLKKTELQRLEAAAQEAARAANEESLKRAELQRLEAESKATEARLARQLQEEDPLRARDTAEPDKRADWLEETLTALGAIPGLVVTAEALQPPSFVFIHGAVQAVEQATGFPQGLFGRAEADGVLEATATKEQKVAYLTKLVDCLSYALGSPHHGCKPSLLTNANNVLAGRDPRRTNLMLLVLCEVASGATEVWPKALGWALETERQVNAHRARESLRRERAAAAAAAAAADGRGRGRRRVTTAKALPWMGPMEINLAAQQQQQQQQQQQRQQMQQQQPQKPLAGADHQNGAAMIKNGFFAGGCCPPVPALVHHSLLEDYTKLVAGGWGSTAAAAAATT